MADLTGMMQAAAGSAGGAGWDISTATYNGSPINFINVDTNSSAARGFFFKPDGTKLYFAVGSIPVQSVQEYDLSTAWSISTASYLQRFNSAQLSSARDVFFKPDGTKMYGLNQSGTIVEDSLSTAWDVTSASFTYTLNITAQETSPQGLFFKPDGTKMYVVGQNGDDVNEYSLSSAWDLSTASYTQNFSVASQDATPAGLSFKSDGTKMYVIGDQFDSVYEYALSTAWNISTASYTTSFSVAAQGTQVFGLFFKDDGTKMYMIETNDYVYEYSLSSAWDISTASFTYPSTNYLNVSTQDTGMQALFFKPDGTVLYAVGLTNDSVYQYSLSTAWDISTASYVQNFSVATEETSPRALFFKDDGTKMYVMGSAGDDVNEYNLSSAWDISTASYSQNFSIGAQETTPRGLFFSSDGTKMYVLGSSSDAVNEYTLSTAWDVSSASYLQNFSVAAQDTTPNGLFFKPDGTKMFITGQAGNDVNEYTLSTPWDVSTASYSQNFFVGNLMPTPSGLFFKPDGTKMFICDPDADAIFTFDLT